MKIGDVVQLNPLNLVTVSPDLSISEAAQRLSTFSVGIAVVMDHRDKLVGVLSERDIVVALGDGEVHPRATAVDDFMIDTVLTISPEESLADAVFAMNANGIRHLVVAESGGPVGVISIRDILRVIARQILEDEGNVNSRFKADFVEALAAA